MTENTDLVSRRNIVLLNSTELYSYLTNVFNAT